MFKMYHDNDDSDVANKCDQRCLHWIHTNVTIFVTLSVTLWNNYAIIDTHTTVYTSCAPECCLGVTRLLYLRCDSGKKHTLLIWNLCQKAYSY